MGHVVNPFSLKLGNSKFWISSWNNITNSIYKSLIFQDFMLEKFLTWLKNIVRWKWWNIVFSNSKFTKIYNKLIIFFNIGILNYYKLPYLKPKEIRRRRYFYELESLNHFKIRRLNPINSNSMLKTKYGKFLENFLFKFDFNIYIILKSIRFFFLNITNLNLIKRVYRESSNQKYSAWHKFFLKKLLNRLNNNNWYFELNKKFFNFKVKKSIDKYKKYKNKFNYSLIKSNWKNNLKVKSFRLSFNFLISKSNFDNIYSYSFNQKSYKELFLFSSTFKKLFFFNSFKREQRFSPYKKKQLLRLFIEKWGLNIVIRKKISSKHQKIYWKNKEVIIKNRKKKGKINRRKFNSAFIVSSIYLEKYKHFKYKKNRPIFSFYKNFFKLKMFNLPIIMQKYKWRIKLPFRKFLKKFYLKKFLKHNKLIKKFIYDYNYKRLFNFNKIFYKKFSFKNLKINFFQYIKLNNNKNLFNLLLVLNRLSLNYKLSYKNLFIIQNYIRKKGKNFIKNIGENFNILTFEYKNYYYQIYKNLLWKENLVRTINYTIKNSHNKNKSKFFKLNLIKDFFLKEKDEFNWEKFYKLSFWLPIGCNLIKNFLANILLIKKHNILIYNYDKGHGSLSDSSIGLQKTMIARIASGYKFGHLVHTLTKVLYNNYNMAEFNQKIESYVGGFKIRLSGRYQKKLRNKPIIEQFGSIKPVNISSALDYINFIIIYKYGVCGIKIFYLRNTYLRFYV